MNIDSTTENLITPKTLASLFGVSIASIYRLVDSRKIPFYKVGGCLRFAKDDIDAYLESHRVESIHM